MMYGKKTVGVIRSTVLGGTKREGEKALEKSRQSGGSSAESVGSTPPRRLKSRHFCTKQSSSLPQLLWSEEEEISDVDKVALLTRRQRATRY
jgi:hypothetical protein